MFWLAETGEMMFIFGCVTKDPCRNLLFDKLTQYSTGGYDAFGIAINGIDSFDCAKGAKSVNELREILPQSESNCGFIHARWATCGERCDENAHPFVGSQICTASNGTIENAGALRSKLSLMPYPDSDGAVLPHLLAANLKESNMLSALRQTTWNTQGEFSMVVMRKGEAALYAVNHGAPLYAAMNTSGTYIASELSAFDAEVQKVYLIAPGEIVQLHADKINIYNQKLKKIKKTPCTVALRPDTLQEQSDRYDALQTMPAVMENLIRLYTDGEKTSFPKLKIRPSGLHRIYFAGCGTSHNLARAGAYNFEAICDIPAFAFSAGEYCCSNAVCDKYTLFVALSASGETAETLSAAKAAEKYGAKILIVTSNPDSRLARMYKNVLILPASKAGGLSAAEMFDCGYVLLCLLAVHWGVKQKTITPLFGRMAVKMASSLPDKARLILKSETEIHTLTKQLTSFQKVIIIGQNVDYAAAREGALQISDAAGHLIPAVPASELRHTLQCAIDRNTVILALISGKELAEKTCAALTQAKIRGATTIVCTGENLLPFIKGNDVVFAFPDSIPLLGPVCHGVVLQLLSRQIQQKNREENADTTGNTLRYFAV